MVWHNLHLALRAARDLKEKKPELYDSLNLSEKELEYMKKLLKAIKLPKDPDTGNLTEDDNFHMLQKVELNKIKRGSEPSYRLVCYDALQRYKVIKQPDVLLAMTRFPELFSPAEKGLAWEEFEPICVHDSALSFASHALFAFQNNLLKEGLEYLRKALL